MSDQILIRIDGELKKRFGRLAKAEGKTTSLMVRELISGYVKERDIGAYIDGLWGRIGKRLRSRGVRPAAVGRAAARGRCPRSGRDRANGRRRARRSDADRALDAGRQPAALLAFFDVRPGMRVAELGAAGGYTTELLARAVAPGGVVYAQDSPFILARFAEAPWTARLAKPVMRDVVRLDRDFDDPFPAGLRDLDLVLNVLFYHDTVWMGVDRPRMNRAILAALRPGGIYGIVDHSARPGTGTHADGSRLARIRGSGSG